MIEITPAEIKSIIRKPFSEEDYINTNYLHPIVNQMLEDIKKMRESLINMDKEWDTIEKTCPKCCPDGNDPDWNAFGN